MVDRLEMSMPSHFQLLLAITAVMGAITLYQWKHFKDTDPHGHGPMYYVLGGK